MNLLGLVTMFAADNPLESLPVASPKIGGMRIQDMLFILVPISVIMLLLVLWAVFIRKPQNVHARTRVYRSKTDVEELDDGTIRKKKRHKRPRREHRQRNPTLSEAGGLPPRRPEDAPPPI